MKKSIHFILPAGGVRGSFQAGFLYELFTKYSDSFKIHRVDGTSVGSINGIATICGEFEILKDTWCNITSINDLFEKWSNAPIIGALKNLYLGFYNNGAYNNESLNAKLENELKRSLEDVDNEVLDRFSCVVTDVNKGTAEYISGTNPKILEYVTASASPWVVTNPKTIDDNLYTDGAVLETYPLKYIDESDADMIVIVGFDQEVVKFEKPDCSNLLFYLAALLDISRFHSFNSFKIKEYVKNGKCIPITNTMKAVMSDFDTETITTGFKQGQHMATMFYKTYLERMLTYDDL